MGKFEKKVKKWLEDDPTWLAAKYNWICYFWHNRLPRNFRFLGITHWFVRFAVMASAPALAHFVYKRISLFEGAVATGVLFALFSVSSFLDRWSKSRNNVTELASAEGWIRIGDLITSVKSSATPAAKKDDTVVAALGVIEAYARQITKSPKGEISVSLALYSGTSTTKMTIRHRNPGNERPIGRTLKNLERVLGHRACQAGPEPRVVGDLKRFGREAYFSPTQSSCNYRSIVLIPITGEQAGRVKGFVSVDCARPHAFNGNIAEKLVVTIEPLTDHIEEQF